MPLSPGSRLGPYEIVAPLGAGGMGEVYRGHDTRLKRDVAIKVLPSEFAADPERLARFRREAELLATLNHPNIAIIHGLEETADGIAIAMELVEGESLAQRVQGVRDSGFGISDSVRIARQICDALEAAHDKGIVHRDLKPGNIMLTHDGQVKVLDFGLAKIEAGVAGGPGGATHSPTLTFAGTQVGMILGTAAYMSPEQAKGRVADKRSDVWAFGCVLYELLTGKRAFDGEDVSDVLATVLKSEPDWAAFPPGVPAHIQNIVKRCLAKDRKARIPDMSVVRFLFDDATSAEAQPAAPTTSARLHASAIVWKLATALLLLTTVAGFAGWYAARSISPAVARFYVLPPEKGSFVITTAGSPLAAPHAAISPDGRTLAFAARDAAGKISLWVRPIESVTSQSLAGTDGASYPFWSPDSRFIAFFAGGKLMKIPAAGGPTQTLCAGFGRGGTWGREGVIVFNAGPGPLLRVSSAGGEPVPVTKEAGSFPSFLPDGRHVMFFRNAGRIDVASVDGGELKPLINADSGAIYARNGYLLFVRQGTLLAQAFDAKTLTLSGEAFPIAERVQTGTPAGHIAFSVSDNGVLAYGVGTGRVNAAVQLTWVNRQGKVTGTVGAPEDIRGVDLSPDGTRLAIHRHTEGQGGDVWITDLSRGTTSRFTFDATQDNASPIWSPDAGSVAFSSRCAGKNGVYRKASNQSGEEELLVEQPAEIAPTSWSTDGRALVYSPIGNDTGPDLWILPLAGDRKPIRLLSTRFSEAFGQVSPDGRWLVYSSNESGANEIYVRPFPTGTGKWQISARGGICPRWRRDGRELFYMNELSGGRLLAVDVKANESTFEAGTPKPLFDSGYVNRAHGFLYHPYTVTPDGQRFLIPRPVSSVTDDTTAAPVIVVMNWAQGIRK